MRLNVQRDSTECHGSASTQQRARPPPQLERVRVGTKKSSAVNRQCYQAVDDIESGLVLAVALGSLASSSHFTLNEQG